MMKMLLLVVGSLLPIELIAAVQPTDVWERIGFEQRLSTQVPLELRFRDERGHSVRLGDYFTDKPVVLVLGYYSCKNLCSVVMDGLLASLGQINFNAGNEFEVVAVSINPRETPALARMKKTVYLKSYNRPGTREGLHFLTANQPAISMLTRSVGFRYFFDPKIGQYVHAAGITVLTPAGRIARYLYGVHYQPSDLRLSLVEASKGQIGSVIDQLLLLCAHYDPTTGKYGYAIWTTLRAGCVITALLLGGFIVTAVRRERASSTGHAPAAR
jgi:protein SCO1/2